MASLTWDWKCGIKVGESAEAYVSPLHHQPQHCRPDTQYHSHQQGRFLSHPRIRKPTCDDFIPALYSQGSTPDSYTSTIHASMPIQLTTHPHTPLLDPHAHTHASPVLELETQTLHPHPLQSNHRPSQSLFQSVDKHLHQYQNNLHLPITDYQSSQTSPDFCPTDISSARVSRHISPNDPHQTQTRPHLSSCDFFPSQNSLHLSKTNSCPAEISPQLSPSNSCPVQASTKPKWTRWCHPFPATFSGLCPMLTRMSATPSSLSAVVSCLLLVWSLLVAPCAAFCPSNCTCDVEALVVQCAPSNIDVLPITFFPSVQRLTMYGTDIRILNEYSFFYYQGLRHVNLSNNVIMEVSSETFKNQQKLEELHLAKNRISNISSDTFVGLRNLIVLSLQGNVIESLEAGVFSHLKLLEDLDLSENQIHTIEDEALVGLANLRVLHLQSNRLHAVPTSNLDLVPDLAELTLGGNEVMEVRGSAFRALRTLRDLDLSGTIIDGGLVLESFRGLSALRKLNLEGCGLTSVPTTPLGILRHLEELHIGQNLFVTLPEHAFRNNRNLQYLFVSQCPYLVHVETNVLEHNLNIKEVIVTENPGLTYIAAGALRSLPRLRLLDLRNNNLQHVSQHSASWTRVEEWHLEGNPISCNCSSAWLRTLLLAPNSTNSSVVCASPPKLAGTPLYATQLSDLACGLNATTQGVIIGVTVCVLVVAIAAVVLVLLYRHHNSCVHRLLKGLRGRQQRGDIGTNDQYVHIYYPQPYTKAVPVTEL